jgi:hypothetical protein
VAALTTDLTFEDLRGEHASTTTLAYWFGLLAPRPWPPEADAAGVHRALSYQYEIEEQAGRTGRLFPEDVDWRKVLQPLAPVQLTRAWSPLPDAHRLLGQPDWSVFETASLWTAVGVAWLPPRLERLRGARVPRTAPADQARFFQLLTIAAMRGLERRRGLFIAACPGWDYDHGHSFDRATQGHMRRARFVFVDRHPQPAPLKRSNVGRTGKQ